MTILPTWSMSDGAGHTYFRDNLTQFLETDSRYSQLNMYFYAVTQSGWNLTWPLIQDWMRRRRHRKVHMYCGLSNWVSEPSALEAMMRLLPKKVWIVKRGHGVFHPKALVFHSSERVECFSGSNNLTLPGLISNFEMATRLTIQETDQANWKSLEEWETSVQSIATPLTRDILTIYREEYEQMIRLPRDHSGVVGKSRIRLRAAAASVGLPTPRSAVMQVMPKETGSGGSQLQIPKQVAEALFGLSHGTQRLVTLLDAQTREETELTLTDYGNSTRRLSIHRLTEVERPRIIWFKHRTGKFEFDIVSRRTNPMEYDRLLTLCLFQTNQNSKRWGMYEDLIT